MLFQCTFDGGKLVIKSGKFKTFVNCYEREKFPEYTPQGSRLPVPDKILPALKSLLPFVSTDENRPWANGILFSNNSALATNSICIVEHWLPVAFPVIANIPRDAVEQLVKLKLEPTSLQVAPGAVIFHLPGEAWFACSVMTWKWPDTEAVFKKASEFAGDFMNSSNLETILNDVGKLEKFTGELGAIHFHNGLVSTSQELNAGTSLECPFAPSRGSFRADQLSALRGIVDRIGFDAYPAPVPFYGGHLLRGVMVGFQQ
jgi:DNA polymerase III sliding clamp (beta) subunit (PCNA family)